jgi:GT2 family glycosyltransferase
LKEVAVVILNYNGLNLLKQFLQLAIELSPEADVIVADNASTDGSVDWLKNNLPDQSHLIEIHNNLGFCGGYNYALEKLTHTYFVLLNSDVEVTRNWLPPLLDMLKEHPEVAACQPKIKSYHKKSHFEYAGAAGGFIDVLGYPFARGRIFDILEEDTGQYNWSSQVFWASGACMCIRANLYNKYQLDELFFAHMEEIDLC